jgi:hypothetical protein
MFAANLGELYLLQEVLKPRLPLPFAHRCYCCSMTAFDRDNLQLIFSALVDWWLRKFSYSQNISKLAKGLVGAGYKAAPQCCCQSSHQHLRPLLLPPACCKSFVTTCIAIFQRVMQLHGKFCFHTRCVALSTAGWRHA